MPPDKAHNGSGGSQSSAGAPPAGDLVAALGADQIQVHYLPTADLDTAGVIGAEALVRSVNSQRDLLAPSECLLRADLGPRARALTERVIELSAQAAGDWWRSGLGLRLAVNLPDEMLSEQDWELDEFVARTLSRSELPATALRFEVTEHALTMASVTERLGRLSELGASISVDHFGAGRFSIQQLTRLPIDELKIDRSFISDLADEEDKTIVRSIIRLAHQMGLQVVADGVETDEAWRQLRSMGAQRAQGLLISKPLPSREVPAWLASWNHRARELRSTRAARSRAARAAEATTR